jgi:hypothetical protein
MGPRTIRHLVSAGVGIAAAPSVAFLFLDGVMRTAFLSSVMRINQVPGLPPGVAAGLPLHSVWLAAIELAAAGVLAGVLAGAGWVTPVGPLVAGLPMLALHFYTHSTLATLADVMRYTPSGLVLPFQEAVTSDAFLLIGGALTVSALAPWRWRAGQPPVAWANWHAVGVVAGMAAIPALWLVLQVSEGVASNMGPPGIVRSDSEFLLFTVGGAIVIGLLASARWLSPVAALIAGIPLVVVGLFALLMPSTVQKVIVQLVYGQYWQPATETLAASGWLVFFGGMLLASGITSGRWRREPRSAHEGAAPMPGPGLGPAPNPEFAPNPEVAP